MNEFLLTLTGLFLAICFYKAYRLRSGTKKSERQPIGDDLDEHDFINQERPHVE